MSQNDAIQSSHVQIRRERRGRCPLMGTCRLLEEDERLSNNLERDQLCHVVPHPPVQVTAADHERRPILPAFSSVNQRLPSGPVVIPAGQALGVGSANWVMVPVMLMRPIWLAPTR